MSIISVSNPTLCDNRSHTDRFHCRALKGLPATGPSVGRFVGDVINNVLNMEFLCWNQDSVLDDHIRSKKHDINCLKISLEKYARNVNTYVASSRQICHSQPKWSAEEPRCPGNSRLLSRISAYTMLAIHVVSISAIAYKALLALGVALATPAATVAVAAGCGLVATAILVTTLTAVFTTPSLYAKKRELANLKAEYNTQKTACDVMVASYEKIILDTGRHLAEHAASIATKDQMITRLREDTKAKDERISNLQKIANIKEVEITTLNININNIKSSYDQKVIQFNNLNALYDQKVIQANNLQDHIRTLNDQMAQMAPKSVPRLYARAATDPTKIMGAWQKLDPDTNEASSAFIIDGQSPHYKTYGEKLSMDALLATSFDATFDRLLAESKADQKLHFNDSAENAYQFVIQHAVYQQMVLDLIDKALLDHEACDQHMEHPWLDLNGRDLKLFYSEPITVQRGRLPNGQPNTEVYLNKPGSWTPDEIEPHYMYGQALHGIDPISAKLILNKLTTEEKNTLRNLILENLIDDDHPELVDARRQIDSRGPRAMLIKTAHALISAMAASIKKRFDNTLNDRWIQKATGDGQPFVKPERAPAAPEQPDINAVVSSEPAWACMPPELVTMLEPYYRHNVYFWAFITEAPNMGIPSILARSEDPASYPKNCDTLGSLNQYVNQHTMIGNAGCLYSSLAKGLLLDNNQLNQNIVNNIKTTMANFLDIPANKERFRLSIQRERAFDTVENYQQWLRSFAGQRPTGEHSNDLDILIFSHTFGVQVNTFLKGSPLTVENGLVVPQDAMGPNTRERIFLFNNAGTFFGLRPQLRAPAQEDPEDLRNIIQNEALYHSVTNQWLDF